MINDWGTNDNFSHGYFIPFVSAYVIFTLRSKLKKMKPIPTNWGLVFIRFGLFQLLVAKIGSEFYLQRTSLVIVLFGITLFLCGFKMTRLLWLPLAYLLFMVPIPAILWNRIAFSMQLIVSAITEEVIRIMWVFRSCGKATSCI